MNFNPDNAVPEPSFNPDNAEPDAGPPVREVLRQVVKTKPDTAAEVERLAKRYPAPYEVIERNVDDFQMFDAAEGIAAQLKQSPLLENAIRRNPRLGALAHDDVAPLAKIESGFAKTAAAGAAQGVLGISEGIFRTPDAAQRTVGYLASAVEKTGLPQYLNPIRGVQDVIRFISEGRIPAVTEGKGGTTNVAADIKAARDLLAEDPQTFGSAFADVQTLAKNADQALRTAITTGNLQQVGEVITDPNYWGAFLSQAMPSLYLAIKSGGSLAFMGWLEGMEQASNAAEFEAKTGQKISDADFTQAVAQTAIVNALLERYGLDKVLGAKGNGLKGIAKAMVGEGGTEGLQQINTNLAALFSYNEEQGVTEGLLASIMGGVGAGGAVATAQTAVQAVQDRQRQQATAAQQNADALQDLLKAAGSSALRERSPEQFRALMGEMTDGKVYVDANVLNQLPEEVLNQLPESVRAQIPDEAAKSGTVEIPVADVLTVAPGAPLEKVIVENARMTPDGLSRADAVAAGDKAKVLRQEAERVIQQAQDQEVARAEYETVRSMYAEQIAATGRHSRAVAQQMGDWIASFYTAYGSRVGMTASQFQQRYPLRVLGAPSATASGPVMDQGKPTVYRGRMSKGPLRMTGGVTYFTDSRSAAQSYIDTRTGEDYDATDANVMEATLDLKNPASADDIRRVAEEQGIDLLHSDYPVAYLDATPALVEALKAAGYDGAVGVDGRPDTGEEITAYAVFSPDAVRPPRAPALEQSAGPGTPAFEAWFGDSKVVDAEGKPLVVYHGTGANFERFDTTRGAFFTSNYDTAELYSEGLGTPGGVAEVYLSLRNPVYVDGAQLENLSSEQIAAWEAQGYDGAITTNGETEYVAFRPEQIKSAIGNRGTFDPQNPSILEQSVSTRLPTAKKATENPLEEMLIIGLDAAKMDREAFEANMAIVRGYPNMRPAGRASADTLAERFIQHVVDNLLWLHDQVPADIRSRSKLWYDGARAIVDRWTPKYGLTDAQVSAVLAVLSPQKDWFMNVSLAERVLDAMTNGRDFRWDQAMTDKVNEVLIKSEEEQKALAAEEGADYEPVDPSRYYEAVKHIQGKTLGEVLEAGDDRDAAIWIRVYDQAFNTRNYRIVSPEGDFLDWKRNNPSKAQKKRGEPGDMGRVAWGSFGEIGKAVSVVRDGSIANISNKLGGQHKVRNFYNNIFNPQSEHGDVTIDTHAVAAALLRPLAGGSDEVKHNFGSGGVSSSSVFGAKGTYGIYAEAYRRAAAERKILPREMQSITWEAVRGLFQAEQKKALQQTVNAVWRGYRKGEVTLDEARAETLRLANGIVNPDWVGTARGAGPAWASSYSEELAGAELSVRGGADGRGAVGDARGTAGDAGVLAQGSIDDLLAEYARPATTRMDAERSFAAGDRLFVVHEQAEEAREIFSVDQLGPYTPDQILILPTGAGTLEQGPRGTFNPRSLELVLNPNANLSTWFHEAGHFFLEVMADIASQPNAPAQIEEDMGTFLKWAGITGDEDVGGADSGVPLAQMPAPEGALLDDDGQPMRLYHGTSVDVQKFRPSWTGELGPGVYLTTSTNEAGGYTGTHRGAPNVMPVYVTLRNPLRIASADELWSRYPDLKDDSELPERLQADGYDGVVFPRPVEKWVDGQGVVPTGEMQKHVVAFDPKQIVSAISGEVLGQGDQPTAPSAQPLPKRRTPLEVWNAMTLDQKRPYHERWAESIEQYVMEGKAPSVELQPLMRRFATWLKSVYGSIKQFLASRGQATAGGEALNQVDTSQWSAPTLRAIAALKQSPLASKIRVFGSAAKGKVRPGDVDFYVDLRPLKFQDVTSWGEYSHLLALARQEYGSVDAFLRFQNALAVRSDDATTWVNAKNTKTLREDMNAANLSLDEFEVKVLAQDPAAQPGPPMALNDDIRRVMDRMLATDEQIAQANEVAGLVPNEEADGTAAERLNKRSMRDLALSVKARDQVIAKLRKQAAAIEKDIREQVTVEVDSTPEMRAKRALDALTVSPEYAGMLAAHKAARKAAEDATRAEVKAALLAENPDAKGLVKGQLLMKNKRDIDNKVDAAMIKWDQANPTPKRPVNATDADVAAIADSFPDAPWTTVDEMMQAIDAFGSRREAIDAITEQRMLEEHGDLIDERAIQQAANEAVHNEARARALATELRTQAEMLNKREDTGETNASGARITVNALVEAAKQFGANVVSRTTIRDLRGKAWQHTAAERRAGKRWQEATAAGKTAEAVKAKQDQVLNNAAAKAAIEAQAEAKKILDFFRRVTKGNDETVVEKGRDADIVNAARAVLRAYGVESPASKGAEVYLEALSKNDPETFNVVKPMVDAATANAQPLDALTFEELQALHEEVQAMWFLAKRSRQMEVDGDLLDVEEVANEVYARLEEIGIPDRIPGEGRAVTFAEERALFLQQGIAFLRRVEQWAEGMDGKYGGPFLRYIFQPVKVAADRYRADRVAYRKKFQALVDNLAPIIGNSTIEAPELGTAPDGKPIRFGEPGSTAGTAMNEILHAIAHTGNDSNKRKLLLGRGWATENADGTLDTSRWDAFVRRLVNEGKLERAHYDFVQGVWDLMEQTKPLAQRAHRDAFGRYFAEVTAAPFIDPFGVPRAGGYIPAQVDPRQVSDNKLKKLAEEENSSMAFAFPQPAKGFTMARVEGYTRPLMLDLRTLSQHLDKVLLFSHMTVPARDVRKLLTNKKVGQPLDRIQPAAIESMLTPWLARSAQQVVETPVVGAGKWARIPSLIRARAGMALMFANVSNSIQQITGLSSAAVLVKPSHLMRAMAQHVAHPVKAAQAVWAASPYMDDRAKNEVAVMNEQMQDILIRPGIYQRAQSWSMRHAYFMQTGIDNALSPIVWTGAYNQALTEGQAHDQAVQFADSVVRRTQGSTLPEDVSRLETGPAYARVFTQFVSYFNMMANTNGTAIKNIANEVGLRKGAGKAFGVVMLGFMIPIWVAEAIAIGMRGGPEDEDDDGYLDDWLAAVFGFGTVKGLLAQIPIVGQFGVAAANRFNDNPLDDRVSMSPAISLLESSVGAPESVYKAIVEDGSAQKAIRDVATLASVATGIPVYGLARPVGYLAGIADDRIEPTGPLDMTRGLITGTASPDSKQR